MKVDRELIGEAINFIWNFGYAHLLEEAIKNIDNPNDSEDVCEALDNAIIYYDAQWKIMMQHQSPSEANLELAFECTLDDIFRYIDLFNAKYGKTNS